MVAFAKKSEKPLLGLTAISSLNFVTKVCDVILGNNGVISRFPQLSLDWESYRGNTTSNCQTVQHPLP